MASAKYGMLGDKLTAASVVLQDGVKIVDGKPVFKSAKAEELWQALKAQDCATIYDQVGTVFGLCVKEGMVENPPLFGQREPESLSIHRARTVPERALQRWRRLLRTWAW